jgi:hypothetical protein
MNIEHILEDSFRASSSWSAEVALDVAHALESKSSSAVDWDCGAGEEWARVVEGDRAVALVSTAFPLAIVERSRDYGQLAEKNVSIIAVESLDSAELACSDTILQTVFGDSARLHSLDPSHFSAHDLWYATV